MLHHDAMEWATEGDEPSPTVADLYVDFQLLDLETASACITNECNRDDIPHHAVERLSKEIETQLWNSVYVPNKGFVPINQVRIFGSETGSESQYM